MKKKIFRTGLALAAILVAVGLVGCPSPNDNGGPTITGETKQTGATLEWATIGTVEESYPNEQDAATLAAVLAAGYDASEIALTAAQNTADITYGLASSSDKATVEVARIEAANTAAATTATFSTTLTGRTWADGDWLVVKVTSEDGSNVLYYRFNITLGKNAFLQSVTIGMTAQTSAAWLGEPGEAFADITIGDFQTDQITGSSVFLPVPQDEAAAVSYLFKRGTPTDLPAANTLITFDYTENPNGVAFNFDLDDDLYLYVKVVSTSNPPVSLNYVMKLVFPKTGEIAYGVPKLVNPSAPGDAFYIDPIWDTVDWDFDISRANQAETVPEYFKGNYGGKHTTARAKALWDDNGIWVLVDADVSQFRKTPGGALVDRPVTPTDDHNGDSVEIFINERLQALGTLQTTGAQSSNDIGNQFRLGVAGNRTGETASAAGGDDKPTLAPFNAPTYTKFRTVLKKPAGHGNTLPANYAGSLTEATNGGFMLLAYVPFKFKDSDNADAVFDSGKVKAGAKIGFELQLNVNSGSSRDGILTWNGLNTMAYQNAAGYGVVTLSRNNQPEDTTVFPEITAQTLSDAQYVVGTTTGIADLSVTTTGTIQWFSSPSAYGPGTAITTGGTAATFTPPVATQATTYYYAVVTSGGVSVVTNRRAKIEVASAEDFMEKWTFENVPFSRPSTGLNTDGSINITGSEVFGYKFPIGNFIKAAITVEGTGTGALVLASKQMAANGDTQTADGCSTNATVTINAAGGAFAETLTYTIGTGSGTHANLYNGGVVWQVTSGAATNFRITKVVFTVPDAVAGDSFYVNIADVDDREISGFGKQAASEYKLDTDGTPMTKLTFSTNGDSSSRARAVINLPAKITEALGTSVAGNPPAYTVTITGTAGGSNAQTYWFAENATQTNSWNVFGLTGGSVSLTAPTDYTLTLDNAGKKATVFVARVGSVAGTDTLEIRSIKVTPRGFEAVTDIGGIPEDTIVGTLALNPTITPAYATNKTIVWTITEAGTTGATITGSSLTLATEGTVKIKATIANGTAEGTNFEKEFTINVTDPPTTFDVKVGDTTQTKTYATDLKTWNVTIMPIPGGYQVTNTEGNNWTKASFNVNLGTKTLADFTSVKVTVQPVSGSDYGYKKIHVYAADAETGIPTGSGIPTTTIVTRDSVTGDPAGQYSNQTEQQGNTNAKAMEIYLNPPSTLTSTWTAHEVEIAIFTNFGKDYVFKITNIEFVAAPDDEEDPDDPDDPDEPGDPDDED